MVYKTFVFRASSWKGEELQNNFRISAKKDCTMLHTFEETQARHDAGAMAALFSEQEAKLGKRSPT